MIDFNIIYEDFPKPLSKLLSSAIMDKVTSSEELYSDPSNYDVERYKDALIKKHASVFDSSAQLQAMKGTPMHFDLMPITSENKPRILKELDYMIDTKIVRSSSELSQKLKKSPDFVSPSLVVPKTNGSVRFIVDFRELNRFTSDEFCIRTDLALSGLPWLLKIIDDLLVQAPDFDTLLKRVVIVLKRCLEHGIKLSIDKLQISQDLKFAGFQVGKDGVGPDHAKLSSIKAFPSPTSISELRSFLGLANQLGSFMPDLAHATIEMRKLLKKDIAFVWLSTHEQEFKKVKDLLTSPALVKPFNPGLSTMANNRLQRMREKLIIYSFDLRWTAGKDHLIADALSRAPHFPPDIDGEVHVRRICSSNPALAVIYGAVDDEYL
eukprot:TCALIF_13906-PA protein Name:"Similar to Tf2-9 Transposon Tf2-9 polyprotein (Schizosaccharomyces pombe (strain 972 / ATCC 24843))" AED:0.17 eAED:0.23 QI:71/0/0/1/0/0/4/0/378